MGTPKAALYGAVIGLLLIGGGVAISAIGAHRYDMPWLTSLGKDGGRFICTDGEDWLPITREQFWARMKTSAMAGWFAAGGLWLIIVSFFYWVGTRLTHSVRGGPRFKRAVLVALLFGAGFAAAAVLTGFLTHMMTGTSWRGRGIGFTEGEFVYRTPRLSSLPITRYQYQVDREMHRYFGWLSMAAFFVMPVLFVVFGMVYIAYAKLLRKGRHSSGG